jgi:hypothetical protein
VIQVKPVKGPLDETGDPSAQIVLEEIYIVAVDRPDVGLWLS